MKKKGKNLNKEKSSLLNSSFENNTLLSLRRRYSESEAVKMIEAENSILRIENGKLTSYFTELEEKVAMLEALSPADLSLWKFEKNRNLEIKKLKNDLEKAREDKNYWEKKYFDLLSKSQQK